jgi:hypothetical protein
MARAEEIRAVLAGYRFRFSSERELQDGIARVLDDAGFTHRREAPLGPLGRSGTIDFLVGDVGVEIKIKGALAQVTRQLHRYAEESAVRELLLVTGSARLDRLPSSLCGKPLGVLHLLSSAF